MTQADATTFDPQPDQSPARVSWLFTPRIQLRAALIAGGLLIGGVAAEWSGFAGFGQPIVWISLAIGMVFGLRAALESLRERKVDIDVLMVVGAGLAAGVGHPEEGALLLVLFVLAGAMEDLAMQRTRREIEALHRLMPTEALVLRDGAWAAVDPHELRQDETIRIRPGDVVPVDAIVLEGRSALDQSTLTGESLPREVEKNAELYAGAINLSGTLEARVLRPADQSSLQRVLNLVVEARRQREPIQRLIDRVSEPYAVSVMIVSSLILLSWWLLFGDPFARAAYTAITLLIVMSPCALIIATPTVTLAAIGRGARGGVLFKGGQSIERLSRISAVCLDKTGTLTLGRPTLTQIHPIGWSDGAALLSIAAALEADSSHPIATAIRDAVEDRGVTTPTVEHIVHTSGRGVEGVVHGRAVRLGSLTFVESLIPVCLRAQAKEVLERMQRRGQTGTIIAQEGAAGEAAVLILSDPIRPAARHMIEELHEMGVRPVRMLTGDNSATAETVARKLGVDVWDADLFPEQKVEIVRAMKAENSRNPTSPHLVRRRGVAFVGDGVNDAPALAAADVGVAIGSIGSDAALESADIVLLSDDLRAVPWAIRLSRRARRILAFNIIFALSIIIGMGLAVLIGSRTGFTVPLSVGVIAHEGGTVFVVLNSLRLLGMRGVTSGPISDGPAPRARSTPAPTSQEQPAQPAAA